MPRTLSSARNYYASGYGRNNMSLRPAMQQPRFQRFAPNGSLDAVSAQGYSRPAGPAVSQQPQQQGQPWGAAAPGGGGGGGGGGGQWGAAGGGGGQWGAAAAGGGGPPAGGEWGAASGPPSPRTGGDPPTDARGRAVTTSGVTLIPLALAQQALAGAGVAGGSGNGNGNGQWNQAGGMGGGQWNGGGGGGGGDANGGQWNGGDVNGGANGGQWNNKGGAGGNFGGFGNTDKPVFINNSGTDRPNVSVGMEYTAHQGGERAYLRDMILGVNDGLVSMLLLLVGLVGGGQTAKAVLLAGITGAVAGAISMALGEFLATKSQTEVTDGEIALEKTHFQYFRDNEIAEVRETFEKQLFLTGPAVDEVIARIGANDDALMNWMLAWEFGVNEVDQRSPLYAMLVSGGLFLTGAAPSVLPFTGVTDPNIGLIIAAVLCSIALFSVGAIKTYMTKGPWVKSGLENLALGGVGALISFGIGKAYNVRGAAA